MNLFGIGPGGQAGDNVELPKQAADHFVGVTLGTQPVELRHHLGERSLDVADGAFGIELALLFETPLALGKFFAIKTGMGMQNRIALWTRVGQEA